MPMKVALLTIKLLATIDWRNVLRMLNSPKMQRIQRSVRINEGQLLGMAEKARLVENWKLSEERKGGNPTEGFGK